MEAARILAHQGHRTYLYEEEKELGGNYRYACLSPHKEEFKNILDYLKVHMGKLKVKVRLGIKVNEDMIKKSKFDVLLLATGAKPIIPEIKGIHSGKIVFPTDIITGKKDSGKEVVIMGGQDWLRNGRIFSREKQNNLHYRNGGGHRKRFGAHYETPSFRTSKRISGPDLFEESSF